MPITTDDQIPTSGFTPTIVEHAMAFDSNENATVSPASESRTRLGFSSLLFKGSSGFDGNPTAAVSIRGVPFCLLLCHFVATVQADVDISRP